MNFWNIAYTVLALIFVGVLLRYRLPIIKFVGEVKVELDKCSWPWDPNQSGIKKYKELFESTGVVITSVILLAGFVTTSDWLLAHVIGAFTGVSALK